MLRFPLWLTADLTRACTLEKFRRDPGAQPIHFLRPVEMENTSASESGEIPAEKNSGTELLARVRESCAPVVWIGGPEPLLHPEMGQLTRCIAGHGQHVFLETHGALLRRRIHEFRPVSRLFLTVQLDGLAPSHNLRAGRADAFQLALEGIRAARLSGFLICVHARIDAETSLEETGKLLRFAEDQDVDGFVISQASGSARNPNRQALMQKTVEARKLIRNRWWEFFSQLVERALNREDQSEEGAAAAGRLREEPKASEAGVRLA